MPEGPVQECLYLFSSLDVLPSFPPAGYALVLKFPLGFQRRWVLRSFPKSDGQDGPAGTVPDSSPRVESRGMAENRRRAPARHHERLSKGRRRSGKST